MGKQKTNIIKLYFMQKQVKKFKSGAGKYPPCSKVARLQQDKYRVPECSLSNAQS